MPSQLRLVQLGGEVFSLDIPLHRTNGDAKTPNGEFSPFPGFWARDGAHRRQAETHEPRVFGCLERLPV